jgi:hypothetical protein
MPRFASSLSGFIMTFSGLATPLLKKLSFSGKSESCGA